MTHPVLAIFGYSDGSMFLRATPKPNVAAIISIHGRREFGIKADVAHRLDLAFDDVDVPPPGDEMAMLRAASRRRWCEQNGLIEVAPTPSDAAAIIEFARAVRGVDGMILCHCGGGMSRAPAAALICLAAWRGPGSEADCVTEILRLRRGAAPHGGLVRFADGVLGRGGRLVHALAAFQ
jgi:predicted protein tyrosine phosphatase